MVFRINSIGNLVLVNDQIQSSISMTYTYIHIQDMMCIKRGTQERTTETILKFLLSPYYLENIMRKFLPFSLTFISFIHTLNFSCKTTSDVHPTNHQDMVDGVTIHLDSKLSCMGPSSDLTHQSMDSKMASKQYFPPEVLLMMRSKYFSSSICQTNFQFFLLIQILDSKISLSDSGVQHNHVKCLDSKISLSDSRVQHNHVMCSRNNLCLYKSGYYELVHQ